MPNSAKNSASKVDSTPAVAAEPTEATKNGKRDAEEIMEEKVASGKKQKIANGGVSNAVETKTEKKTNKKQESDSLESEEEEKKEEPEKPADVAKNGAVEVEKKVDSNDQSETANSDSSDEEDAKDASEAKAPVEPAAKVEEESNDDKQSSDVKRAEPQAIKEANGSEEEDDSLEEKNEPKTEDDSLEEEDEPKSSTENDADVEMVDVPSAEKAHQTPATPQATGSKIVFMGNLNFSIEESDVINFFKDAGKIVEVRFAMRDDRFAGFAHVEFATPDAAQKALKLDKELLLDRTVRLEIAKERGAYTPSNGNDRSSQNSGQSQGLTIFVRGFGTDDGFDSVRSALEEHFGQCGEITRISIPKDYESGGPKGVAFIDFTDSTAFNKALELGGSEVGGGTIIVEEAKQKGGGGGGYGRDRGGRSGGRGRFGGRDGGRGRGRGRFRGR